MSRLGVVSDTHDNLDTVRQAVALFNRLEVERVVHCGDIVAQSVVVELGRLTAPVSLVYGNCDGDRKALAERSRQFGFDIGDGPLEVQVGGKRVVASHQPMDPVPDCDYYLHGHTHRPVHAPGRPATINPGECCGSLSGRSTVAVLDTATGEVEFHYLGAAT